MEAVLGLEGLGQFEVGLQRQGERCCCSWVVEVKGLEGLGQFEGVVQRQGEQCCCSWAVVVNSR